MAITESGRAGRPRGGWRWLRIFLIGLLCWIVTLIVMVATANPNLVPTVILLGSFLIPVTALIFDFDHRASAELAPETVFFAFLLGGLLGVLAAGTLEAWLLAPGPGEYLEVGLIEEGAKLAVLTIIARRLPRPTMRDGIVLGAAVGFGFAALESSGYAFTALLARHGLSVAGLVSTEVLRGLLAPVGHGLWTAIVGAVLFQTASRTGRLRLTGGVAGAYLLVAALHGLWDGMGQLAVLLTVLLTATPGQELAAARPTAGQVLLFMVAYWAGELIVAAVGLAVLAGLWRRAGREPLTDQSRQPPAQQAA
jgi:RsiW-degrading membrane proteinase PrsW (M82 family)